MQRPIRPLAALAATAFALLSASAAGAAPTGDASGPRCADFVDGRGAYTVDEATLGRVVLVRMNLPTAPCPDQVTYTLAVTYTVAGQARTLASTAVTTTDTSVAWRIDLPATDVPDRVRAEVSTTQGRVLRDTSGADLGLQVPGDAPGGSFQG
jgi:hypothetical protein